MGALATQTPTASSVPIANGSGKLDTGWIDTTDLFSGVLDTELVVGDAADPSKQFRVEVNAGQTTEKTLTLDTGAQVDDYSLTIPVLSGNDTIVTLDTDQTISGSKAFSSPVTAADGSEAAPGIAFDVSPDTGIFFGSGVAISYGGARRLTVSDVECAVAASIPLLVGDRTRLAQVAGSAVDGDLWHDSTQKALQTFVNGLEHTLSGCIFTQTATRTIADTVTETSLFTTGVGTLTLPANFLLPGKTIRLVLTGTLADTATPTVRLRLKYGSTTVIDSTALTLSALAGTEEWRATCELTCRTAGALGTVAGDIWFMYDTTVAGGDVESFNIAPAVATVDTTASGALDLSWEWGSADPANTVSCIIASVEVLN